MDDAAHDGGDGGARFTVRPPAGGVYGPATMGVIRAWASEGRVPADAMIVPAGGGEGVAAGEHPALAPIVRAPPTARPVVAGPRPCPRCAYDRSGAPDAPCPECGTTRAPVEAVDPDATGGLIPYKNPAALASYYTAIGSGLAMFVPAVGPAVSIAAIVLSARGMRAYRLQPARRGIAHAWIGMIGGVLTLLFGLMVTAMVVIAVLS